MTNLNKTSVTRGPSTLTIKGQELHIFPPRDAVEAETRGVFVAASGKTYCHFNGSLTSGVEGIPGNTGLVLAYNELADKIGDLLIDTIKAAGPRSAKKSKLTVKADCNVEINPEIDSNGVMTGNQVTMKVYGFLYEGNYYTTRGEQLVISERTERVAPVKQSKVSFF